MGLELVSPRRFDKCLKIQINPRGKVGKGKGEKEKKRKIRCDLFLGGISAQGGGGKRTSFHGQGVHQRRASRLTFDPFFSSFLSL